ncbi:MAG: hypothetical protein ABIQ53_15110 [Terracoccus sp.]
MTMTDSDRISQFKSDIAEMKLKTGGSSKEGPLQAVAVLLMVAGIALTVVAYFATKNITPNILLKTPERDASAYTQLALLGLTLAVVGAAMFLRYSLAKFLRLWLLRQIYEGQAHVEQIAAAVKER